ncbi:hypothetical protein K505DRAFT_287040 [Melanomma pulvis-pyrius CBS 109.77]|uniref:Thioredoxin domain-containing protein n=1 Tax=Melanomma pulvis-pyrius CBS 109.77 TaxID=1314802 RepID=A0A6A6WVH9_9PLEO|nr:hypothetical protein K505DRAFT_287040 [Melanomma pulvis-pyrius CBS 109.77]
MSWQTELKSWMFPSPLPTTVPPIIGQKVPQDEKVPIPSDGKPTIVSFLRHCGCPFAEKTFLSLRSISTAHPDTHFIAVSHSNRASTDSWLEALGGPDRVQVIVDPDRESYAAWGLGVSSFWHILNPWSMYSVYTLGKQEGIWNRPTESGTRWQSSGSFAVDRDGVMRWGGPSRSADDVPDFGEAMEAIQSK